VPARFVPQAKAAQARGASSWSVVPSASPTSPLGPDPTWASSARGPTVIPRLRASRTMNWKIRAVSSSAGGILDSGTSIRRAYRKELEEGGRLFDI
jgi:hypothetical protein